ncbi:MAG: PQQ-binding-like beta-propeller repeat protein [Verrucomicrobia bacterium]|nr:PQQ-binding-like beta-propeller repeat protein [Verrucomicrobiota bacterium]
MWIAALFCVLVSATMLYQHWAAAERDPWKSPRLLALKEQLREAPTDETVKAEIRRLDLEFRERYVRRLSLNKTGGWLLVGGLAALLIAARTIVKQSAQPYLPKRRVEAPQHWFALAAQSRWGVVTVGAVALAGLATLAVTARSPLPQSTAELDRLLGRGPADESVVALPTLAEFQANWPRFRGWDGGGVAVGDAKLALTEPAEANVLWKSPVPVSGFNSPIVWSNRVFLSGGDAAKREVVCYDANTGQLLWQRVVEKIPGSPAKQPDIPEMTGFAAPTMATDGRRAFVIFANGDLAAFNFDGSIAWAKNIGVPKNMYGHATSLAVWPGRLIVQLDQDEGAPGGSKLLAFDTATGRLFWERPRSVHDSWASPIIVEAAGKTQIITLALQWAISHSLTDGNELWRAEIMEGEIAPSPTFTGGLVVIASPSAGLFAIRPDGAGDVTKSHLAWSSEEPAPDITSPVSNGELVFTVLTMGALFCFDLKDGKLLWEHDLEMEIQGSPSIVGDQLLLASAKGHVLLIEAAREFKETARIKLEDAFYASPALVDGRVYLRGTTNLWCLGAKQ